MNKYNLKMEMIIFIAYSAQTPFSAKQKQSSLYKTFHIFHYCCSRD